MPNCGKTGDQTCGEVRKIGFRASVLRTPDGSEVIVPNSELTEARVINWSLSDRLRRISISVSAAYGTSMILSRTVDPLPGTQLVDRRCFHLPPFIRLLRECGKSGLDYADAVVGIELFANFPQLVQGLHTARDHGGNLNGHRRRRAFCAGAGNGAAAGFSALNAEMANAHNNKTTNDPHSISRSRMGALPLLALFCIGQFRRKGRGDECRGSGVE